MITATPPASFAKRFLQLLFVVIGRCVVDLLLDLLMRDSNILFLAGTLEGGGVVLSDCHALGFAEHLHGDILELDAMIFGIGFACLMLEGAYSYAGRMLPSTGIHKVHLGDPRVRSRRV